MKAITFWNNFPHSDWLNILIYQLTKYFPFFNKVSLGHASDVIPAASALKEWSQHPEGSDGAKPLQRLQLKVGNK